MHYETWFYFKPESGSGTHTTSFATSCQEIYQKKSQYVQITCTNKLGGIYLFDIVVSVCLLVAHYVGCYMHETASELK